MTNQELIDHLKQFPPDAEIAYRSCSEYDVMEVEEVRFAPDGTATDESNWCTPKRFVKRGGRIVTYNEKQWDFEKDGQPVFVPLILFPGN